MSRIIGLAKVIGVDVVMRIVARPALHRVARAVQRKRRRHRCHRLQGRILRRIVVHVHRVIVGEAERFVRPGAESSSGTHRIGLLFIAGEKLEVTPSWQLRQSSEYMRTSVEVLNALPPSSTALLAMVAESYTPNVLDAARNERDHRRITPELCVPPFASAPL